MRPSLTLWGFPPPLGPHARLSRAPTRYVQGYVCLSCHPRSVHPRAVFPGGNAGPRRNPPTPRFLLSRPGDSGLVGKAGASCTRRVCFAPREGGRTLPAPRGFLQTSSSTPVGQCCPRHAGALPIRAWATPPREHALYRAAPTQLAAHVRAGVGEGFCPWAAPPCGVVCRAPHHPHRRA